MNDENLGRGAVPHSLIPLVDFKAVLGLDDRDEALSRYCLITATYTIEQYCKRRLLRKKRFEFLPFYGDYLFPLRDYPVREIITISKEQGAMSRGELIDPEFYRVIPDCSDLEDIPHCLSVSPTLRLMRGTVFTVRYWAGYVPGKAPPDLASACLELAAWNMSRYRGRRIGMTGNVRGEGLEPSIPVQVLPGDSGYGGKCGGFPTAFVHLSATGNTFAYPGLPYPPVSAVTGRTGDKVSGGTGINS